MRRARLKQPQLLWCLIVKNLKVRFGGVRKRTAFGILLSQLSPAFIIAVYAFVAGGILKVRVDNFAIYLAIGHLHWTLFTSVVCGSCNSIKKNASLIKAVRFPYSYLVWADILDLVLQTCVSLLILTALLPLLGGSFSWVQLLYPLVFLLQVVLMSGLAAAFSALTGFFYDLPKLLALVIRFVFWFTPIIYTPKMVPEQFRDFFLYANPMALFLNIYRELLCSNQLPDVSVACAAVAWSFVLCFFGWAVFFKLERYLPEEF